MFFLRVLKGYSYVPRTTGIRGLILLLLFVAPTTQAEPYPEPVHGDFALRDFRFVMRENVIDAAAVDVDLIA